MINNYWNLYWKKNKPKRSKVILETILKLIRFNNLLSKTSKEIGLFLLKNLNDVIIVEAGSGEGTLGIELQNQLRSVRFLFLIDICEELFFKNKDGKENKVIYLVGDIYDIPLKDNICDLCLNVGTVEHFFDPLPVVREMRRVSRNFVLCAVPAKSIIWTIATTIRCIVERDASLWTKQTFYFPETQLLKLFDAAGIKNCKIVQQKFLGIPLMNICYGEKYR